MAGDGDFADGIRQVPGFMAVVAKENTMRPNNNTLRGVAMTSTERHEARYQRRKAARERKRREYLDEYDNFERVANPAALMKAHFEARRGVLWKYSPALYNKNWMKRSAETSEHLRTGKRVCQGFYSFHITERGKPRSIHSVHYTERVIRRSACTNSLVPIFTRNLIYDNGASLKGKGITFSGSRCETHLHRYFREYGDNDGYVIVIDFRKFFDNIRHDCLYRQIDQYVHDKRLNDLCRQFVEATDANKPEGEKAVGCTSARRTVKSLRYHTQTL